jgi:hypothetical protein
MILSLAVVDVPAGCHARKMIWGRNAFMAWLTRGIHLRDSRVSPIK